MMSLRRTAQVARHAVLDALPTVVGIVVLNFLLLHLVPGDAVDVLAGQSGSATAATMDAMRAQFGLDRDLWSQLLSYFVHLAHFDLGQSVRFGMPVSRLLLERIGNTLILMVTAQVLALILGILLGWIMATFAGRWLDRALSVLVLIFYSTPGFWIGLMAIVLFSVELGWLPNGGTGTLSVRLEGLPWLLDRARHLVLPALALASFFMAIYARLTRAALVEVQYQDFMRTAHAKGLHPLVVQLRHGLRNALLPVTTVAGIQLGNLLGGAVVVETVFNWSGMGQLALEAVQGRDFNVLLGVLLISSILVIVANAAIDLLHAWLDPRTERADA